MENNSVRVFVVSDIHWDTDGEDIEIPKELTIQISEDEELEEDEIEEYIKLRNLK
jgi:hypothetical protein